MPSQASTSAVTTVFQNVFGRAPNSQESSTWATQLDSGATPAQLAAVLADSPEGAAQVSTLYQQILGRGVTTVSSSEIASAQAYLALDKTNGLLSLRTDMAFSAEAQADIKAVYQNVLGRAPTSSEITSAETALQNGATLAQLYTSAAGSSELTANLGAAYKSAFGTAPSATVLALLRQQIDSSATFANLTSALTGHTLSTATSLADTFNPAESLLSSASTGGAAPATVTPSTPASAASLVHLTTPATTGVTPVLHST